MQREKNIFLQQMHRHWQVQPSHSFYTLPFLVLHFDSSFGVFCEDFLQTSKEPETHSATQRKVGGSHLMGIGCSFSAAGLICDFFC